MISRLEWFWKGLEGEEWNFLMGSVDKEGKGEKEGGTKGAYVA